MKEIKIYTLSYCPYCAKALELLAMQDVDFKQIDITQDEDKMIPFLKEKYNIAGDVTLPQIIVDEKTIGGYSDIKKLHDEGKLSDILK